MEIDKTTLTDLVIVDREEEFSIFNKINFTVTARGREQLRTNLLYPLSDIANINNVQQTILFIKKNKAKWPFIITNGTVMVIEKFYDSHIDAIPSKPSSIDAFSYKLFHGHDYTLVKYSVLHFFNFIKGMQHVVASFLNDKTPQLLKDALQEAERILNKPTLNIIATKNKASDLMPAEMLELAHFFKYRYKINFYELLHIFCKLDAWHSMAIAIEKYNLCMPHFIESDLPHIEARNLYNLMLQNPVAYNVLLNEATNFLFLTGANMAGKSTYLRSIGINVVLTMAGAPACASLFEISPVQLLSSMRIADNLEESTSTFYAELKKLKTVIEKINAGEKVFVLLDEILRGTNSLDRHTGSEALIRQLIKQNAAAILATHDVALAALEEEYPKNIHNNHFDAQTKGEELFFDYKLKDGVCTNMNASLLMKKIGLEI